MIFSNANFFFTELYYRHRLGAIHPTPLQPNIRYYQGFSTLRVEIPARFYTVAVENNYIIGAVINGNLYPLLVPRLDSNIYERVKVQLNDYQRVPILHGDPLENRFHQPFLSRDYNILIAERPV